MSVFTDYIENSDDILLQKYHFGESDYGTYLQGEPWLMNDLWVDVDYAWCCMRDKRCHMNYKYGISIKQFSKSAYLNALKKRMNINSIKTLIFKKQPYYNYDELCQFHREYELMIVWRYCRFHKIHWEGHEKITLTNEDNSQHYEYIQ